MAAQRQRRGRHSPLFIVEAFGLSNPWLRWRIAQGDIDDTLIDAELVQIHVEDFGGMADMTIAANAGFLHEMPVLRKRIDMHAPALG